MGNSLSRMQKRQVEDWILANEQLIQERKYSSTQVASLLTRQLQYKINANNVLSSAAAMEKSHVFHHHAGRTSATKAQRYHVYKTAIIELGKFVCQFADEWKTPVPPTLLLALEKLDSTKQDDQQNSLGGTTSLTQTHTPQPLSTYRK